MSINNLAIVENEKIFQEKNKFYCDNIDAKSIPEGINNFRKIYLIARKSKVKRVQQINLSQVKIGSNIFLFLNLILKTFSEKNINYLLISINPYTFLSALILLLFKKKVFIYLRSSGHEESKADEHHRVDVLEHRVEIIRLSLVLFVVSVFFVMGGVIADQNI